MFRTCRLAHLSVCVCVCVCVHLSVGQSVRKVYCGKTVDWICMPFGMVSGVGHGMGVVDGVHVPQVEGAVLGVWHPHSPH